MHGGVGGGRREASPYPDGPRGNGSLCCIHELFRSLLEVRIRIFLDRTGLLRLANRCTQANYSQTTPAAVPPFP